MNCARHADVETNIRCANCDTPVCPKCMVYTPVGIKCPDCARLRGRTVSGPPAIYYLRAAGAGLPSGLIGGVLLSQLVRAIPFGGLLLVIFLGMALGEIVSVAARRNTGPAFQAIAGASAALAFLTAGYFTGAPLIDINGWQGLVYYGINPIRFVIALVGIYLAAMKSS